jgi:hypothetical protein
MGSVYVTPTSLIQLYSFKFTVSDLQMCPTFRLQLLRNANPREAARVPGKIYSELAINEKENACRLLHMKIIFPFLFPRNVLTNELTRIQCFGRQEQVLQDETMQPLKQKLYYMKSRWTVYYIFTRNLSLSHSLSRSHVWDCKFGDGEKKIQAWKLKKKHFVLFPKADKGDCRV